MSATYLKVVVGVSIGIQPANYFRSNKSSILCHITSMFTSLR